MGQPLRVLLIEDNEDDVALLLRLLRRGGYEPEHETVQSGDALGDALLRGGWDIVFSDYSLPRLDALDALEIIREHSSLLPCIVVSGNIGEETAVQTMRAGANDYLMKSNLTRLLPAVERELRDVFDRRERVRTQRAFLDLQEQFGVIFREFADAMLIARADDAEGEVLHANPALERNLGFAERTVLGRPLSVIWPESRRRHAVQLLERVRTETSVMLVAESFRRADGASCPMDVLATLVPWGRGQAVVVTLRDVTERRRAERRLAAEKEQLAVTLRSIGEGVITTDPFGRVVLLNRVAEDLTGWSQTEAAGRSLREVFPIVHASSGEELNDTLERIPEDATTPPAGLPRAVRLRARTGQEFTLSLTASSIRPENEVRIPGSPDRLGSSAGGSGAVLVFRDITHERRLEEEMTKASKLESLGILAGGIAHDFNNLLMAILGSLSLAKFSVRTLEERGNEPTVGGASSPEALVGILEKAEEACHYASDLTRQLLTFAKGGAPIKRVVAVGDLVRETIEFALHGTRLLCGFDLEPDLRAVEVDRNQFRQVLDNVVINAVQATPEGGRLEVRARNVVVNAEAPVADLPSGAYICVSIQDTGAGIAPESLPKIFDPFFTTKESGTGLGLATSYSIIKKHAGVILVDSAPGQGATFSIYLPASPLPVAESELGPVVAPGLTSALDGGNAKGRRARILFMDDEEILRDLVAEMLRSLGYAVASAANGEEAIERFTAARAEGDPFDAVIVDLTVPGGMGGLEAVTRLRELDPGVRAIVSSGYSNDPIMADHGAHGFRGVIAKPYQMAGLARVLEEVLAGDAAPVGAGG